MIKLCVFDLAGTTIKDDDAVNTVFRLAFKRHSIDVTAEEINRYMGLSKPIAIANLLLIKLNGYIKNSNMVNSIHDTFVFMMKDYYREYKGELAITGAPDVFHKLHEMDIKVALDTGFNKNITDVIISKLGWDTNGLVDAVVSSDEVLQGRPYPDMIEKIMNQLGLTYPSQVAKIGDTPADLLEGRSANCGMVVGVTEGSHTKEQLEPYYHTHLIPNINHLIDILK
jgi:phosphonatase-like hydrolase